MSKRFMILDTGDYNEVIHTFALDSRVKAINAFRTLYGDQPQYVLFEQVACSEPAGSCDEVEYTGREDSVQQRLTEQGL